ncbi:hypothetical protein RvY_16881-3 [Ramazzottius varieornatus]|uniref:G-protein coupled receptors family 1 profile domain-containing protein n=1 Tax=Ramazzottius varieornatus TaxID=947166 RepID=A0A1D1W7B7_RAMVA|nr:hypothetical protein RvY_16881-3 [Ramazzottius varieornatus]
MVLDGHHPENSLAYSRSAEPTHTRGNRLDSETFDAQSILGVECAYCLSELQRRDQRRIAAIIGLFIAAWTPINIFILTTHFFPDSKVVSLEAQDMVNLSLTWLGFLSTCWNPFIIHPMLVERAQMYDTCKPKKEHCDRKSSTLSRRSKHRSTTDCSSKRNNEPGNLIGARTMYGMRLTDSLDSLKVNV